jgi:hypothetical protein
MKREDIMNTAKMTLAATVLTTALSLMVGPASAHCPHNGNENHKHCDTGGGGGGGNDPGPANPVIAFVEASQLTSGQHTIKAMDADGGNQTVVLDNLGEAGVGFVNTPSWSPDGDFLAFSATEDILGCRGAGLVELDPVTNEWSAPVPLDCTVGSLGSPTFRPIEDGGSYTLAASGFQDALPINPGQPDERISSDLIIVTFAVSGIGTVIAGTPDNISNTPGISEVSPSWSPSGIEIVVQATDFSLNPSEPSTWVHDVAIYNADGSGAPESLVTGNPAFPDGTVDDTDAPDWARTNADMILFGLELVGGDYDIYCIDISTSAVINVTQHLDESDGAELDDWQPSWLPDDSGFLFSRDSGGEIVELKFGNGYDPAAGCPEPTNLTTATTTVLAKGKRRKTVGSADYWRNATP